MLQPAALQVGRELLLHVGGQRTTVLLQCRQEGLGWFGQRQALQRVMQISWTESGIGASGESGDFDQIMFWPDMLTRSRGVRCGKQPVRSDGADNVRREAGSRSALGLVTSNKK